MGPRRAQSRALALWGASLALLAGSQCMASRELQQAGRIIASPPPPVSRNVYTSRTPDAVWALQVGGGKDDATENAGTAIDSQGNGIFTGTFQSFQATFGVLPNVQFLRNRGGVSVLDPFSPVSGDVFVAKVSNNGTLQWVQQYGSPDPGDEAGLSVATDSLNNVYTVGSFVTTATFGSIDGGSPSLKSYGANDGFLAKASPSGSTLWVTQFGGPYNDRAMGVTVDCQDNVYVTGQVFPSLNNTVTFGTGRGAIVVNTTLDMFIAKASPTGTLLWVNTYGGTTADDNGMNIASDCSTGSVVVTGYFSSNPSTFGVSAATGQPLVLRTANGSKDGFVLRVNATGSTEWVYPTSGSDAESLLGVAIDPSTGDALVTGQSCSQTLTFGAGADVTMPNLPSLDRITSQLCDKSTSNSFIARINRTGALQWVCPFTGFGDVSGQDIAVSPTGEIIAAGYFRGSSASFGHYNPAAAGRGGGGGGGGAVSPGGLAQQAANSTAITLNSVMIGADAHAFVVKASSSGSMLWALSLGNDQALGVSVDPSSGTILVSGTLGVAPSTFPVPGGGMPIKSRGGKDTWIAQVYLCAKGQFLNASGCFLCQAGYFCPGSASMVPCGMGNYCPQGTSHPIACPIGQLTLTTTSSACIFAPPPPGPPPPNPPQPPPLRGSGSGVAAGIGIAIGAVVGVICIISCVTVYLKKHKGGGGEVPLAGDVSGIAMTSAEPKL